LPGITQGLMGALSPTNCAAAIGDALMRTGHQIWHSGTSHLELRRETRGDACHRRRLQIAHGIIIIYLFFLSCFPI
jgi:hypothetical protein